MIVRSFEVDVSRRRKRGPFLAKPHNLWVSPLGVIPKSKPGSFRIIHDLSYPEGHSVNDGIADEDATCEYGSLKRVIAELWSAGPNALLAKVDVSEAYKHVPVAAADQRYLGSTIVQNGISQFYCDTVLPFGLKSSARIFTDITRFVSTVIQHRGASFVWNYCDDFVTVGPPATDVCLRNLRILERTLTEAGFELSSEKREGPSTRVTVLGWVFDTARQVASVPEEKRKAILDLIEEYLSKKSVTKRQALALIGKLNYIARLVRAGRPYLAKLIAAANGPRKLGHYVNLSKRAKQDLIWWAVFLERFDGSVPIPMPAAKAREVGLLISTDASDVGLGGVCGRQWFSIPFDDAEGYGSINVREMLAVAVAFATWSHLIKGHPVVLQCDNEAVVKILDKGRSSLPVLDDLVRFVCLVVAERGAEIIACHIPGSSNAAADSLSRLDISNFRSMMPGANREMTTVVYPHFLANALSSTPRGLRFQTSSVDGSWWREGCRNQRSASTTQHGSS
jgi:hypothetical protein